MSTGKASTQTMRERIYNILRQRFISGEIPPGRTITVGNIAKEHGVSLIPVREALFQLEIEKLIIVDNNRSFRVNSMTGIEIEETYNIRKLLECDVAEKACEIRSEESVAELKTLLDKMEDLVYEPSEYQKINRKFHFEIYSSAELPIHLHLIDWLWARTGPYLTLYVNKSELLKGANKHHHVIYEAYANKDKEKIKEALYSDFSEAIRFFVPYLNIHPIS